MKQYILDNLPLILGIIIPVLLGSGGLLLKWIPKQKQLDIVGPACEKAGIIVSKFLLLKLGKKAAQSIEEGVISTFLAVWHCAADKFTDGLFKDNKEGE